MSNLHSTEIRELVHEPNNNIDCESGVDIIGFPDKVSLLFIIFNLDISKLYFYKTYFILFLFLSIFLSDRLILGSFAHIAKLYYCTSFPHDAKAQKVA